MSQHAPRVLRVNVDTTRVDPKVDLPIWTGRDTPLYVTEIIQDTHNVYTFRLQGDPLCRFVYYPGQFCTLVLNIDGKKVVRSYSISSSPTRPFSLEITIKRVPGGLVSNWLPDNLRVGDRLEISGPKGRFCLTPGQIPSKLLLLAAGSGITPLMSMTRWLCDLSAGVDIKLQIEYADDGTTPEGGVNAARKLISKGADCILGALTSGSSIAIAQAGELTMQLDPARLRVALRDSFAREPEERDDDAEREEPDSERRVTRP